MLRLHELKYPVRLLTISIIGQSRASAIMTQYYEDDVMHFKTFNEFKQYLHTIFSEEELEVLPFKSAEQTLRLAIERVSHEVALTSFRGFGNNVYINNINLKISDHFKLFKTDLLNNDEVLVLYHGDEEIDVPFVYVANENGTYDAIFNKNVSSWGKILKIPAELLSDLS